MVRSVCLSRSCPSKKISPAAMRPGGVGMSRMTERLVTDLPEPDSPTNPSASPWVRARETRSTAVIAGRRPRSSRRLPQ